MELELYSRYGNVTFEAYDVNITRANAWTPEVTFRVCVIVILMIATLTSNIALVCFLSCSRRLRKCRVHTFLIHLAVGDVMVCLFTMTTEIAFVAFGEWRFGNVGCKLSVYAQIVTLASTTFLLTAMSIDRYQVSTYFHSILSTYFHPLSGCIFLPKDLSLSSWDKFALISKIWEFGYFH